jgi:uncharacterized protein involved in outer membrane biogenesis
VPGVAGLVRLESARAQIERARVVLDRIEAAVAGISVKGEYRYEPQAARPHRVRLAIDEVDAGDLEKQFAPTLQRSTSLIARALGRAEAPDWLRSRAVEGTLRIGALTAGDVRFEDVRGHLLWDATRAELNGIQAKVEGGSVTGRLAVNLRGARPAYRFSGRARALSWQAGRLDVEGVVDAVGTGRQLLARLTSEGTFQGTGLDVGGPGPLRMAAGTYRFAMAGKTGRLRLTALELETAEETLTGRGETQEDGRLLLILSNGSREMRMSGTLAKLRVDEAARQ